MDILDGKCPLCEATDAKASFENEMFWVDCGRCGHFIITDELNDAIKSPKQYKNKRFVLSALARELTETRGPQIVFSEIDWEKNLNHYLIPDLSSPTSKAGKFVQAVMRKSKHFGESLIIDPYMDYPLAYSTNEIELIAQARFLEDGGQLKWFPIEGAKWRVELTAKGWNLANELGKKNIDSKQAFIAMWFNDDMNESMIAIRDAIRAAGYSPMCIKNEHYPERIMDKALSEIRKSRFLVVDLTGNRNSVFFEVGFAYGLGLEIIYLKQRPADENGEKKTDAEESELEFYVGHYKVNPYIHPDEIGEILKNAIGARIH